MQTVKEKLSNMVNSAKEHAIIYKAKAEEKAELVTAKTEAEKQLVKEKRKAKEAKAKMELHKVKAEHAAEKLSNSKQSYVHRTTRSHSHGHIENSTIAPLGKTSVPLSKPASFPSA